MLNNIKIYDLQESIIASGYPMRTDTEERVITDKDKKRILNLTSASNGNGSHGQWLTGVRVAFDLTCSEFNNPENIFISFTGFRYIISTSVPN